jgi:NDP-sugar pyrophosphorylase family protein
MGELTTDRPKGLVEVAGEPLLTHCFETLAGLDVTELVVVVGYRGDDIRSYHGSSFEGNPVTSVDQPDPLRLGDALRWAAPVLDGDFVHLNGDNVYNANLTALLDEHRRGNADVTMLVEEVSRARARQGAVLGFDGGDTVTGLVGKPSDPPFPRPPTTGPRS